MIKNKEMDAISPHYLSDIEPIDFMRANFTDAEFIGFCKGNIVKYVSRLGKKDDPVQDLKKLIQYASWAIEALKEGETK